MRVEEKEEAMTTPVDEAVQAYERADLLPPGPDKDAAVDEMNAKIAALDGEGLDEFSRRLGGSAH